MWSVHLVWVECECAISSSHCFVCRFVFFLNSQFNICRVNIYSKLSVSIRNTLTFRSLCVFTLLLFFLSFSLALSSFRRRRFFSRCFTLLFYVFFFALGSLRCRRTTKRLLNRFYFNICTSRHSYARVCVSIQMIFMRSVTMFFARKHTQRSPCLCFIWMY